MTALDKEGGNYIDEVEKGDLWYFPSQSALPCCFSYLSNFPQVVILTLFKV